MLGRLPKAAVLHGGVEVAKPLQVHVRLRLSPHAKSGTKREAASHRV